MADAAQSTTPGVVAVRAEGRMIEPDALPTPTNQDAERIEQIGRRLDCACRKNIAPRERSRDTEARLGGVGQAGVLFLLVIAITVLWAGHCKAATASEHAKNPINPKEVSKKRGIAQVVAISDLAVHDQLGLHVDDRFHVVGIEPSGFGIVGAKHYGWRTER